MEGEESGVCRCGAHQGAERLLQRLIVAYTWLGVVMIPANVLGAPPALAISWRIGGWRRAAIVALVIVVADAILLTGF